MPTLDGTPVRVKVAPGTPSGRVLRVKGRGVKGRHGTGDLLAKVSVVVPQRLTDAARAAVEALRAEEAGRRPARRALRAGHGLRTMTPMSFSAFGPDDDTPVFVISVAAELAGMHAQTLRQYDRLGLVTPSRTRGGGRRYSQRDVALLREVQRLSQEEGVSLPGIARILELENQVTRLRARVVELAAELDAAAGRLRPHDPGVLGVPERRRVRRPAGRAPAARPLARRSSSGAPTTADRRRRPRRSTAPRADVPAAASGVPPRRADSSVSAGRRAG